jgi:hypothetical protein
MEQLRQPPKRVVSVACPSWCDLSEVKPHGPTLFQIRPEPFFPKRDRSGLFTPGEKPFISHLVRMGTFSLEKAPIPLLANRSLQTAPSYSYYDRFTSVPIRGLTLCETRIHFLQTLSGMNSQDLF